MKVSDLGEFGLIERLAARLGASRAPASDRLVLGIGDDAAVWRSDAGAAIATTDTLVAGVHFLPETCRWRDAGWKALAVNLSDVAAMGGTPEFALVTLGLPADAVVEQIDELYAGLAEAAETYGVTIAGGDIVRAAVFFVTVALFGRAEVDSNGEPLVLRRDAARAGDVIAATGALGGAAGGLRLPRGGGGDSEVARRLVERQARPRPRVEAGRAAIAAGLRCAIDVSDGLLQDLGHICRASGLGAAVRSESLPIEPGLPETLGAGEALRLAATGGEDYELLLTGGRDQIEELTRRINAPLTAIGEMTPGEPRARLVDASGSEIAFDEPGWDHLRSGERS